MISNKNMVASKAISSVLNVFSPDDTALRSRIGLFSGVMPDLIVPAGITQAMVITPAAFLAALGVLQAQFLGCQHYTTAAGRKPTVNVGKNGDGSRNRKININFTAVTTDLIGAVAGTPTFFIGMRSTGATTDASTWAAFTGGTGVDTIIIGTVGDEDSTAELKLVGGKIVVGQGYRMTDLNLQY